MGYKQTEPTIYLVSWPDELLIKAGYSCNQRWRAFCLRGATLHQTVAAKVSHAFHIEKAIDRLLRGLLVDAFDGPGEAEPFLGGRGGGYLEVYRAGNLSDLEHATHACIALMRRMEKSGCGAECTDGRTNELTKKSKTSIDSSLTDTCARVQNRVDVDVVAAHTEQTKEIA